MSIFRLKPEDKEIFKISVNPERFYSSSSSGITGSIFLNINDFSSSLGVVNFTDDKKGILEYDEIIKDSKNILANSTDIFDKIDSILSVSTDNFSPKELPIERFSGWLPKNLQSSQSISLKLYGENNLNKHYSCIDTDQYSSFYNNFHCFNFLSEFAANDAIIYPCPQSRFSPKNGSFTFGFNVKINKKDILDPGTILFRSGTYAISIIPGSSKDQNNLVDKYRLILQLGSGVDLNPKDATELSANCFFSDDNILSINKWNEVFIRWDRGNNNNIGSFIVNNELVGNFDLSSGSPISETPDDNAVVIGSRFEGDSNIVRFFSSQAREEFGVENIFGINNDTQPESYSFINHLNAEVHGIFIKNKFVDRNELAQYNTTASINDNNLLFYVRPNFVVDSVIQLNSDAIPLSPTLTVPGMNPAPFNISFGYNFSNYLCSLENFVREDVTKKFPRLIGRFSGSINFNDIKTESEVGKTIKVDYDRKLFRRNTLILPCDHAYSVKNDISSSFDNFFVNNFNELDKSRIYTQNFLSGSNQKQPNKISDSLNPFKIVNSSNTDFISPINNRFFNFQEKLLGFFDELKSIDGSNLEDEQFLITRRREYVDIFRNIPSEFLRFHQYDSGFPLYTIFKISPLYFGNSIQKNSIKLTDPNFYDTNNQLILKDNGFGGIYRSDCENPNNLNKVGNVYYDHGLIVLLSPTLFYFGQNGFDIEFKGESNLHVMRLNAIAPSGFLNRSTNVTKKDDFALITEINFLDENLNTVIKTKLSQPLMKRIDDHIHLRIKLDF
jgi:hypothetical protein